MAVIKKDGGNMALPIAIKRGNPIALDTTSVWYVKSDMETYAKSGATAYVGQPLYYVDETNKTVEAYIISNEAGTLTKLAATTASGDVAADILALQGRVDTLEETAKGLMPKTGGEFTGAITIPAPVADMNPATKKYVDDALDKVTGVTYEVVESLEDLPETGAKGTIYLVPHEHSEKDIYDEYIWIADKYEKIGNTDINLDGYAKTADIATEINKLDVAEITVGADKTLAAISETDGKIAVAPVAIQIAQSQVTGLDTALKGKQNSSSVLDSLVGLKTGETSTPGLVHFNADGTFSIDANSNKYLTLDSSIFEGIGGENEPSTIDAAIKAAVNAASIKIATTEIVGGIKVAAADVNNAIDVDNKSGVATVRNVTTDILKQGTEEFILNGGTSAN